MPYHFPDEYGVKEQRLAEICKEDNDLRHLYEKGIISKKEYERKKKVLHEEWYELSGEGEKLKKLGALL